MALWKEKFAKKLEGTYASLHKRENRGCRLHILRFILIRFFNLYGTVNRALDDRQIFFGTKFQFVADPLPLFAFLPHDLRVKIPFYGKPAGFNKLYDNRQAGNGPPRFRCWQDSASQYLLSLP